MRSAVNSQNCRPRGGGVRGFAYPGKFPHGHHLEEGKTKDRDPRVHHDARWSGSHTIAQEIHKHTARTEGLSTLPLVDTAELNHVLMVNMEVGAAKAESYISFHGKSREEIQLQYIYKDKS